MTGMYSMYKYREDRVEAGDVEQDKDQPADERLGHVGEDGVADEDAQHRQKRAHAIGNDVAQGHGDAFLEHDEECRDGFKHLQRRLPPRARRR